MALKYNPAQDGVVGTVVDGVLDANGVPVCLVVQAVMLVDETGAPVNIGGGSGSGTTVANRAMFWQETDAPLAASATFNGAPRDVGAASPGPVQYAYFTAMVLADQTGTATIQRSADGATWVDAASSAIVASAPLTLQIPVTARYHRVVIENGATAQTALSVTSSYTAA